MLSFNQYTRQLNELTISPYYQQKGEFNPYYTFKVDVDKVVKTKFPDAKEIKYRSVEEPKGELLKTLGNGKFNFQVEVDGNSTDYYIVSTASNVSGHYGMKTRKDSTASSNVNEFLTLYFMIHDDMPAGADDWMLTIGGKTGGTGVLNGEGKEVTYDDLRVLLDKDETAVRDINIGYENALAVMGDLGPVTPVKYYWVPRGKPEGIGAKNPSDVIIKLSDGRFVGYSNKISAGKDSTPKFNTNITAFYSKLNNSGQLTAVKSMIDGAWKSAAASVPDSKPNAKKAIMEFDITKEAYSESSSKRSFATLAKEFKKDRLNFYASDFYYLFRNNLINLFGKHLTNSSNLVYFLNTIGFYTFDDPNATPCPYKLLIGAEKGSKIKNVSDDEGYREMLFNTDSGQLSRIRFEYDNKSQSFKIHFVYKKLSYNVSVPITMRTRVSGGWSGKSLYISSSGFDIK